jgi:hypothetical protein
MQNNNREICFRQSSCKVVFERSRSLKTHIFYDRENLKRYGLSWLRWGILLKGLLSFIYFSLFCFKSMYMIHYYDVLENHFNYTTLFNRFIVSLYTHTCLWMKNVHLIYLCILLLECLDFSPDRLDQGATDSLLDFWPL